MWVSFESVEESLPLSDAAVNDVIGFINRSVPLWIHVFDVAPAKDAAVVAKKCWAHFNAAPASNAVECAFVADVFCAECFFGVLADFDNTVVSYNAVSLFFKLFLACFCDHENNDEMRMV